MVSIVDVSTVLAASFEVRSVTPAQRALAIGLVALFIAVLTIAAYRLQFADLTEAQQRNKAALKEQLEAQTPESVRVWYDEDVDAIETKIRRLFAGEPAYDDGRPVTLREAADRVVLGWRNATDSVPRRVMAMVEEAAIIAILGAAIFIPLETWQRYFSAKPPYPSLHSIVTAIRSALDTGGDVVALFPYTGIVFELAFAYGLLMVEWVYYRWWLSALVLAASAAAVWVLDRYVPDEANDQPIYPFGLVDVAAIGLFTAIVWAVGVLPAWIGRAIGYPRLGDAVGFLAALVVAGFFVWWACRALVDRLKEREAMFEVSLPGRGWVAAYVVIQRLSVVFIVLAAPYILIYFIVAISTGAVWNVGEAFLSGSRDVQLLVGVAIMALIAVFAFLIRDQWTEIRTAVSEALARKRVRLALFNRALPIGMMVVTYIVAWGTGVGFAIALSVAIVVGIMARLFYAVLLRAKYRLRFTASDPRPPQSALIQAYQLETVEGDEVYLARVNGEAIGHDTLDGIVDETVGAVDSLLTDGQIRPTIGTWHADNMLRFGIVDTAETRDKLAQKVRRETIGRLKQHDGVVETARLESSMRPYPRPLWEEKWDEWRIYGTDEGRLDHRGQYTYLVN